MHSLFLSVAAALVAFGPSMVLADQSLEVDSSSYSSPATSYSYISATSGTISYAINTQTLVISYSTDSNSQIVAATATTVSKNAAADVFADSGLFAGAGVLAGILLL